MHITTPIVLGGPAAARPRGSASQPRRLVLAAGAAAAGAALMLAQQRHPPSPRSLRAPRSKPRISWLAVDALSGAVGEIASLVVLYPLDSLKVLCQARGSSTGAVLAELRALGCSGRALRQLYAGCGSAALCSAAIGAVYLLAFYSAKRLVAAAATTAAAAKQQQQQQQQLVVAAGQPHERQRPAANAGSASQLADGSSAHPPLNSEGTHPLVASLAGVIASLAGSVFEAPMEMFKLRTQAGALDGPMLRTMAREASTRGLGALYATYGAFMLKSIPFDVAELATYSQMTDWREAAAARAAVGDGGSSSGSNASSSWRGRVGEALATMPLSASDMLIGATAGVASVLVSMPCDVIKTRMDLHPPHCPAGGPAGALCSIKAFFETGRQLVAAGGGPHALFVGVAPRLLQTVPSTMVYWMAVEGTRRLMATHFEVDGAPADTDATPAARAAAAAAAAPAPVSLAMPAPALA
ncbi:mitochondrial carrier [Chlorella sorokiniana]|uniref:Mitochondrial carrier n=1 Tax=Chlorella sorokiniana TaxID=3076 RepID=A0A2P6TG71_CHLSO|nr:mitochondrial carrier [Chlorella sorokiniana]|eukprot:PRW33110.1 mitochondrial carrier [Chlorella sorokiniana]